VSHLGPQNVTFVVLIVAENDVRPHNVIVIVVFSGQRIRRTNFIHLSFGKIDFRHLDTW